MNESTLIQLKIYIERAVRPVRASTARKRRIREELLAHVSGVFDEESATLGDDRAALERTALRFGNPAEVTSLLQASVPASDGFTRFWEGRPQESTLRGALRLAWVAGIFALVIIGAALFAMGGVSAWSEELSDVVSGVVFLILYLFVIAFVTHWIGKALHGPAGPPPGWPRIGLNESISSAWAVPAVRVALIADSMCWFMLLCIAGANWPNGIEDWDNLTLVVGGVLFAGSCASWSVFCAWVLEQSASERQRYHEEWACLPID